MIRKTFKVLLLLCIVLSLCINFLFENLTYYAVFYARHTPHREKVEPVLMEVIDSLPGIYKPEIKEVSYDIGLAPSISNGIEVFYKNFKDGYCYHYDANVFDAVYEFDKHFNLVAIHEEVYLRHDAAEEKMIKQRIYKMLRPILDEQPEPSVNLQWIYDLINRDRFNWE